MAISSDPKIFAESIFPQAFNIAAQDSYMESQETCTPHSIWSTSCATKTRCTQRTAGTAANHPKIHSGCKKIGDAQIVTTFFVFLYRLLLHIGKGLPRMIWGNHCEVAPFYVALYGKFFWEDNAKGLEQHGQEIAPMNELICSIIHIYYGRIPLQTDFFLSLIKPIFQHQHIKSVNIRLAIFIFNMSASIKNKPNRHRLNYRHIIQLIMLVQFQSFQ